MYACWFSLIWRTALPSSQSLVILTGSLYTSDKCKRPWGARDVLSRLCDSGSVSAPRPILDLPPSSLPVKATIRSLTTPHRRPHQTPQNKLWFPRERKFWLWLLLSVFRDCMKMGEVDGKKIGCTVSLLVSNPDSLSRPPNLCCSPQKYQLFVWSRMCALFQDVSYQNVKMFWKGRQWALGWIKPRKSVLGLDHCGIFLLWAGLVAVGRLQCTHRGAEAAVLPGWIADCTQSSCLSGRSTVSKWRSLYFSVERFLSAPPFSQFSYILIASSWALLCLRKVFCLIYVKFHPLASLQTEFIIALLSRVALQPDDHMIYHAGQILL